MDLSTKSIETWALKLGQEFIRLANSVMKPELLLKAYKDEGAKVQHYKPEETLDIMAKERLSTYLTERKLVAQKLKQSLENGNSVYKKIELKSNKEWKCYQGTVAEKLQCLAKHTNFTRQYDFVDARTDKDAGESAPDYVINDSANPNFYNLLVDTAKSAVHVPVPVYKYDPFLLEEIYWSGSMFIDGATAAKNILILLDISGSMTGQRYEIAKHTISVIFNTLSENDFFNVIKYNQAPSFLLPCFSNTLVQATLKHKKLVLDELMNEEMRPEGHADLDKVWEMAAKALKDVDSKSKFGCNTAIMLITDASVEFSPGSFKDMFKTKNLRFFSFVVGGDVKESDVKAVQKLACDNYGSMIRIHNLADAQQKVQNYIDVMSKTVAQADQNRTIWTGVYSDDHMSQKLVSTVAFAVVTNSVFRGVVGVTAPIIGLQQMAAVYMVLPLYVIKLGVNAYSFLVDNNGYKENGTMTPIPVDYNKPLRRALADGNSSEFLEEFAMDVLVALTDDEKIKRVYKQENIYYFRGLQNTSMTKAVVSTFLATQSGLTRYEELNTDNEINNGKHRCYLLDEHGYVVYASMITDFMDMVSPLMLQFHELIDMTLQGSFMFSPNRGCQQLDWANI
uniref:VWFA domain-containing protein n=1 Tax=Romanomermis culicivorax TaxID=13658 RepID=A0A915JDL7_ROMCU